MPNMITLGKSKANYFLSVLTENGKDDWKKVLFRKIPKNPKDFDVRFSPSFLSL